MNKPTATDIIIFGALGDLAQRKLLPSLYNLEKDLLLPEGSRVFCLARKNIDNTEFLHTTAKQLKKYINTDRLDDTTVSRLLDRITFIQLDFTNPDDFQGLQSLLDSLPSQQRIFYYASAAEFFGMISQHLDESGCLTPDSRVVLEKPLGFNKESSSVINQQVGQYFSEQKIYRIDH
jgi:glucose-6-phosphate 1-dehydrogenase